MLISTVLLIFTNCISEDHWWKGPVMEVDNVLKMMSVALGGVGGTGFSLPSTLNVDNFSRLAIRSAFQAGMGRALVGVFSECSQGSAARCCDQAVDPAGSSGTHWSLRVRSL